MKPYGELQRKMRPDSGEPSQLAEAAVANSWVYGMFIPKGAVRLEKQKQIFGKSSYAIVMSRGLTDVERDAVLIHEIQHLRQFLGTRQNDSQPPD